MIKHLSPSPKNFTKFGRIIRLQNPSKRNKKENLFDIIIKEKKGGWRIAYLALRDRYIRKLEQHPNSLESFEPVKGRTILFVALKNNLIVRFRLDKPVVLYKGVWHGVVTKSNESHIKITENAKVSTKYRKLPKILK